jgi:hypothetical protein
LLFTLLPAGLSAQPGADSPSRLPTVTLALKDATAAEAAAALSKALGAEVSVAPVAGTVPRITLQLTDAAPVEALDRVAAAVRGRWQPVYSVRPAEPGQERVPPAFATGRRVTLSLENAGPRAALATVALADGGILAQPPDEGPRITVKLEDVPVEEGMDRVTTALGLTWTRSFRIVPGVVSAPSSSPTATGGTQSSASSLPAPRPEVLYPLAEPGRAGAPDSTSPPPARRPDLARALSDGLTRVMQTEPRLRRDAVRQFAEQVERGFRELDALPPAEQSYHRAQLTRVYRSGRRLYQGLTPDQQEEFRPLFDVLRRWLGP